MNERRQSKRHIETCFSIPNPFAPNKLNSTLSDIVPKHIMSLLNSQSSMSCNFVDKLQPFQMANDEKLELKSIIKATEYQMKWEKHLVNADSAQTVISSNMKGEKREFSIWEDSDFLERLNDFIMGRTEKN